MGICLDVNLCDGKLFQRVVEYEINANDQVASILQPISNITIPIDKIKHLENPPNFTYGELVSPINHLDVIGKIETIIWHFKNTDFNFYITINGKKKRKILCTRSYQTVNQLIYWGKKYSKLLFTLYY